MTTRHLITVLLAAGSLSFGAHPKIAEELQGAATDMVVNVVVKFRDSSQQGHFERAGRHAVRGKRHFEHTGSGAYSIRARDLEALASDPDVEYVAPDRQVRANLDVVGPTIGADIVWSFGRTGTGVGVAVIDSGVNDNTKDLGDANGNTNVEYGYGRVVYQENFLVPARKTDGSVNNARYDAKDEYGHGTHIAGIIAGNGYASLKEMPLRSIKGIAPNARIIALKVLDKYGVGNDSAVIEAIDQAIKLKGKYNIKVINLSLGGAFTPRL